MKGSTLVGDPFRHRKWYQLFECKDCNVKWARLQEGSPGKCPSCRGLVVAYACVEPKWEPHT